MAHIQRLAKNRWRARYVAPDGRERSRTFERKVDAELFVASVETDKVRGAWVDPRLSKTTFGEWAASWRSTVVHLKPKTRAGYDSLMRTPVLPEFGQTPLAAITTVRVKGWVADLTRQGLSSSRVRQAYQLFSMVIKAAVESEYLVKSPCIGVRIPRVKPREAVVLTEEQIEALAGAIEAPCGPGSKWWNPWRSSRGISSSGRRRPTSAAGCACPGSSPTWWRSSCVTASPPTPRPWSSPQAPGRRFAIPTSGAGCGSRPSRPRGSRRPFALWTSDTRAPRC